MAARGRAGVWPGSTSCSAGVGARAHRGADWREPAWQQPQHQSLLGWGGEGVVEKITWLQGAQLIGSGRKAGAGSRVRWPWDPVYSHQMWSS